MTGIPILLLRMTLIVSPEEGKTILKRCGAIAADSITASKRTSYLMIKPLRRYTRDKLQSERRNACLNKTIHIRSRGCMAGSFIAVTVTVITTGSAWPLIALTNTFC